MNSMFAIGTLMLVVAVLRGWRSGARAGANPWGAPTLEWSVASPPPAYNFVEIPIVASRYPLWEGREADIESARINQQTGKTAQQLGIVLPYNTIKPLLVALSMTLMMAGLLVNYWFIAAAAASTAIFLYAWLASPLEPEHH